MKNSQILLAFIASASIAAATITGIIQDYIHFEGVANEIAVFVLSSSFAVICAGMLVNEAVKNVRNFFKK